MLFINFNFCTSTFTGFDIFYGCNFIVHLNSCYCIILITKDHSLQLHSHTSPLSSSSSITQFWSQGARFTLFGFSSFDFVSILASLWSIYECKQNIFLHKKLPPSSSFEESSDNIVSLLITEDYSTSSQVQWRWFMR